MVSTRDEVVSTLETSPREVSLPVWDSVSTLDQVRCNKPGHMKGECPENKNEKHKKIHKFKKPKAMVATWSDEDSSEKEEEEKSSSSESEEICFMANSSDGKARSTLPHLVSTHSSARSTLTSSSVDTYPSQGDSRRGRRLRFFLFLRDTAPSKPFFYAGRPHGRPPPLNPAAIPPSSLLQPILVFFLSFLPLHPLLFHSLLLPWHPSKPLAVEQGPGPPLGPFRRKKHLLLRGEARGSMTLQSSQGLPLHLLPLPREVEHLLFE
ncbi:hypothetical protein Taro_037305, partial [Colocasia esculenta]|nr:hypothetical protein [Colocasia esculenta]